MERRADRWQARGTLRSLWDGARRPTFAELFIAFKPLTYFAAAPPRKVTDSACSLSSRRHCLFNRAAVLIKVVDTLPLSVYKMLILSLPHIDRETYTLYSHSVFALKSIYVATSSREHVSSGMYFFNANHRLDNFFIYIYFCLRKINA